jgi:hypothetical protein
VHVTLDQAIEIYARAYRARYGRCRAVRAALDTAEHLRGHGDVDGASVWERVAERVPHFDD